jgi:preprotein translocase subunit SecG/FtsZ-binding cell division protein ZapB
MLSFLKEQEIKDSFTQQMPKSGKRDPAKDTQQEYLTVAAKSKNVRKSTIMLAVLFAIGLLCLCFMIKKSSPKKASADVVSAEETQIETAIAQLTGVRAEMFDRMDEIVRKFYEFSDVLQVEVDELLRNPFELEMFLASLQNKSKGDENFDIDAEMLRQQQLRQQAKGMQLLCIMQSEKGKCCMVNDHILYVGDSIEAFKVTHIGDNLVKLESEDTEVILKLTDIE